MHLDAPSKWTQQGHKPTSFSSPRTCAITINTITDSMAIIWPEKTFHNIWCATWSQNGNWQVTAKQTNISSAFGLVVLLVLLDNLCAQSPAYHELALRSLLLVHLHTRTITEIRNIASLKGVLQQDFVPIIPRPPDPAAVHTLQKGYKKKMYLS